MRHRRISWSTALEDASGAGEVLDAPVAEFEINVNEVDEDGAPLEAVDASGQPTVDVTMPETEEALDDVEEAEEVVEKMEETSEVLENYAVAIEQRIRDNGGLTASEWELVQIGLKSRIKHIESLTPSKESFSYSRLSASNEALDALKEGLKKVWEAIKSAIMAVINRVRKWFIGALSDASRLAKRAKGIKDANEKRSTTIKDGEKTIEISSARNLTNKDGKPMTDAQYLRASKAFVAITDSFLIKQAGKINERVRGAADKIQSTVDYLVKQKDTDIQNSVNAFIDSEPKDNPQSEALAFETKSDKRELNGIEVEYKTITDLLGGDMFQVMTPINKKPSTISVEYLRKRLDAAKVGFVKDETVKKEIEDKQDFPILSRTTISDICDNVVTSCENITRYKKDFEDRTRYTDDYIKKMDKIITAAGKEENVKNNPQVSAMIRALCEGSSAQVRRSNSDYAAFIQTILSKSKILLSYANSSSKMYE